MNQEKRNTKICIGRCNWGWSRYSWWYEILYSGIEQIQTVVKKLLAKLVRFIKLAQEGELAEDYVDEFIKFLQANQKELLALKLDSTVDELFELVYNYTVNFAEANDFDISTISKVGENNKVINLMEYLNLQKNIYESLY